MDNLTKNNGCLYQNDCRILYYKYVNEKIINYQLFNYQLLKWVAFHTKILLLV